MSRPLLIAAFAALFSVSNIPFAGAVDEDYTPVTGGGVAAPPVALHLEVFDRTETGAPGLLLYDPVLETRAGMPVGVRFDGAPPAEARMRFTPRVSSSGWVELKVQATPGGPEQVRHVQAGQRTPVNLDGLEHRLVLVRVEVGEGTGR